MSKRPPLTNRLNLPQAIVDAVTNHGYSKGDADISVTGLLKPPRLAVLEEKHDPEKGDADISVTGLLKPPRLAVLEEKHDPEIVEDVMDRIWSLWGQSTHKILEMANRTAIAERRLSIEMEGWKISGGMDLYQENDGMLVDYKTTSVWSLIYRGKEEWEKQLNLYAVLLRHHGHKVQKLRAIAFARDWSARKAEQDITYPQAPVTDIDISVWPAEIAEKFMRERIILHKQARISLPECNAEERWQDESKFAVMKFGRQRALKIHSNMNDAQAQAGFDKNLYVVHRPGEATRCNKYCPVSKFCDQYQSSLTSSELPTEEVNEVKQAM
jgi:hypothetical protein